MNETTASPDEYDESSVPALWETARWFMRWLIGVCGTPCALASGGMLTRPERRNILHWLRPVEALVRRLLVIEAARAARELPPGKAGGNRPPRPRTRRIVVQDPEESMSWIAYFSLAGRTGQSSTARRARRGAAALCSPWPLAERMEALWRVLENPAPRVKRLARHLARRHGEDIERIARACRTPPEGPPGKRQRLGETSIRHAGEHALRALDEFDTS